MAFTAAQTEESRNRRDAFIRELLNDVDVCPYTKDTALLAGRLDGEQQSRGVTIPFVDLLIGARGVFSLAAGVAPAALDTYQGTRTAQGKKPHQGIFPSNRRIGSEATWTKWPGTHQDSGRSWPTTVLGIASDANGNTLSDAQGRSFSWDFENLLVQAVVPDTNGGTTTFRYDPFGRRIQESGLLSSAILRPVRFC
jgi:hypothetical protein